MSVLGILNKQPREIIDFDIDYSAMVADRPGDTLTLVTTEIAPAGVTVTSTTIDTVNSKVKVIIANGSHGITYKVTVMTSTSIGLLYEDEVTVVVSDT